MKSNDSSGKPESVKGILFLHNETGTEGGFWAIQDERHIIDEKNWSYEGLHILKDGEELTVFDKQDPSKIIWNGTVMQKMLSLFTETAPDGQWIHSKQLGVDPDVWAGWFLNEHSGEVKIGLRRPVVVV